jgi:hypothetical protein
LKQQVETQPHTANGDGCIGNVEDRPQVRVNEINDTVVSAHRSPGSITNCPTDEEAERYGNGVARCSEEHDEEGGYDHHCGDEQPPPSTLKC